MKGKINWKMILALVILALPFFFGLFGGLVKSLGQSPDSPLFLIEWLIYSILTVLILGGYGIAYFIKKMGIKGLLKGILILLILIPLVFLGSCWLTAMGSGIRSVFFK